MRGLICDKQKFFARFLKYKFSKKIDYEVHSDLNFFTLTIDYYVIVFVIYSEEELFDLMKVYDKNIPLIVCTSNRYILATLRKTNGIMLLDISKIRSEITSELTFFFNYVDILNEPNVKLLNIKQVLF